MASVASQLIQEVTARAQSDSLEDAREICADGTYFQNNLRSFGRAGVVVGRCAGTSVVRSTAHSPSLTRHSLNYVATTEWAASSFARQPRNFESFAAFSWTFCTQDEVT